MDYGTYCLVDRLGYYFSGYSEDRFPEFTQNIDDAYEVFGSLNFAENWAKELGVSFRVVKID
jgi:hypothetical protein